jgi:hypothetical protein
MSEMAAFIASATAAVRHAGGNTLQVSQPSGSLPPPRMTNRPQLSAF